MKRLLERPLAVAGLNEDSLVPGPLLLCGPGQYRLYVCSLDDAHRRAVETFVADGYHNVFGARLTDFYPDILTLRGPAGALAAAVGCRLADGQSLFLEQYLSRPVECALAERVGPVCRQDIVELGNFAVARRRYVHGFFGLVGHWLQRVGIEWITFALTASLRRVFERARVPMLDLGPADASQLSSAVEQWGSYYAHGPRVTAVPVRAGLAHFNLNAGEIPRCGQAAR